MKTLETLLPRKHLKTFAFYADHFGLELETLLQGQLYAQAVTLTDEAFYTLSHMEAAMSDENREPIGIRFADDVHALLSRLAELLRRPVGDFAEGLLSLGAVVLADHITDALKGKGMDDDPHIRGFAEDALGFDLDARRNRSPITDEGGDCWAAFSIEKPSKGKRRRAAAATV